MFEIKKIDSKDTFIVRHPLLREGKPLESCQFEGDDLATTTHFGLTVDKKIIGVVSVFSFKNNTFAQKKQFQIRGMAVVKDFQNKGFGKELILHCEKYISELNGELIWFNARENAVLFYKKLGYTITGKSFFIENIGLHYLMKKEVF